MGQQAAYELWFDESGRFQAAPSGRLEFDEKPHRGAERPRQDFPDQLAGLVVAKGKLTGRAAEDLLLEVHRAAQRPLREEVHASEMPREDLDAIVRALVPALQRRGWQPVRLVNREGIVYGDRVANYTQMVAELVLRVFRQLASSGHGAIELRVVGAVVKTGARADGGPETIDEREYDRRIQETLAVTAVRRSLDPARLGWRAKVELASGRKRRELQICDLLSNASHGSFRKLGPEARQALQDAFGPLDQTLLLDELLDRVDELLRGRAYGRALALLAEAEVDPAQERGDEARRLARTCVGALGELGARARDPELLTLANLVEQVIEHRRLVEQGRRIASFLLDEVEAPLRRLLALRGGEASLDWFAYALRRWSLTGANHAGDLLAARAAVAELDRLAPALAGHWEHAPLLIDGMIARAVHRTDCFAHDEASRSMKSVVEYYGALSSLFQSGLPGVFPARIRARARGEALGTRVQAEMLAGLADAKRLALARTLSDEALEELSSDDDRARQHEYRAQIETIAGDLPKAREHLAASLRLETASHAAIGARVAAITQPTVRGFALLHWLRVGRAGASSPGAERDAFLAALADTEALALPWLDELEGEYPVHGILRQAACVHALNGGVHEAHACLSRLRRARRRTVLATVELAAVVEVAGLLHAGHRANAKMLLDRDDRESPGALQLLEILRKENEQAVPELWARFKPWVGAIRGVLKGAVVRPAKGVLIELARDVAY